MTKKLIQDITVKKKRIGIKKSSQVVPIQNIYVSKEEKISFKAFLSCTYPL